MNDKKINNRGFSLIETIVSVMIVAIIMLGISAFISTSRVIYTKVSVSSKLQEEANVTMNFVNELLIEAQDYGWSDTVTLFGTDYTVLCIKTLDNTPEVNDSLSDAEKRTNILKQCYYFVLVDKSNGKIYYTKAATTDSNADTIAFADVENPAGSGTYERRVTGIKPALFESTIKEATDRKYYFIADSLDISDPIDISQSTEKNGRRIKIVFKFVFNGETFIATVNNLLRNKLTF